MKEKGQESIGKKTFLDKFLDGVEYVGNKLPDPVSLFLIFCVIILLLSFVLSKMGVSTVHPINKEILLVNNLLNKESLRLFVKDMVKTFQSYAPLGLVLVTMMGIGLADKSGMLKTFLKVSIGKAPDWSIYPMIIFLGIIFTGLGDAGFIVLPTLSAIIFINMGKSPILGILMAYAGASIGFSTGVFIGLSDILLTSFTIEAARLIDSEFSTAPTLTLFFNWANTILQVIVLTWITKKYVEPRVNKISVEKHEIENDIVTEKELKALKYAGYTFIIFIAVIIVFCIGENAFFKDENGKLLSMNSAFMGGLTVIISMLFMVPGIIYGKTSGTIRSDKDVVKMVGQSLGDMGTYIVIAFAASQFLKLFSDSNLGIILAIKSATGLSNMHFTGVPLILCYIVLIAIINICIASASAKWAMLSPIFVPMFLLLNYDPSITQMAYRIGDSSTNMLTPLLAYMILVLTVIKRYNKNFGLGNFIANMIPYAFGSLIASMILLVVFITFNFRLGL